MLVHHFTSNAQLFTVNFTENGTYQEKNSLCWYFVTTFDDAGIDDLKEMLYFRRLNAFNRSIQNLQESGTTYAILRVDYLL
jgi:hypothetical protein